MLGKPDGGKFIAKAGGYDPVKASRITLLHVLLIWTLGRLIIANKESKISIISESKIVDLGKELASSEFLIQDEDWAINFWPHMFLR